MNPLPLIETPQRQGGKTDPDVRVLASGKDTGAADGTIAFASLVVGELPVAEPMALPFSMAENPAAEGEAPDASVVLPEKTDVKVARLPEGLPTTKGDEAKSLVIASDDNPLKGSPQAVATSNRPVSVAPVMRGGQPPAPETGGAAPSTQPRAGQVPSPAQAIVEGRILQPLQLEQQKVTQAKLAEPVVEKLASGTLVATPTASPTDAKKSAQLAVVQPTVERPTRRVDMSEERQPRDAKRPEHRSAMTVATPAIGTQAQSSANTLSASAVLSPQSGILESSLSFNDLDVGPTLSTVERLGPVSATATTAPLSNPDVARQVAHQVAIAVTNGNTKTTEISLNPEELGRVRLTLSAQDGALTLVVLADRPETQELMRRHIDILAQEFRTLGYENMTFSFSADADADTTGEREQTPAEQQTDEIQDNDPDAPQHINTKSGLDLRI